RSGRTEKARRNRGHGGRRGGRGGREKEKGDERWTSSRNRPRNSRKTTCSVNSGTKNTPPATQRAKTKNERSHGNHPDHAKPAAFVPRHRHWNTARPGNKNT